MGDWIYLPRGSRFTDGARALWIEDGRATAEDFRDETPPQEPVASSPASEVPVPEVPEVPVAFFRVRSTGALLTPGGAAGLLNRGDVRAEDLIPLTAEYQPVGVSSEAHESSSLLPLDQAAYTKAMLVAIAKALGLDLLGNKPQLADRINATGDEAGVKAAVAAIDG